MVEASRFGSPDDALLRASLATARLVTGADNATLAIPDQEPGFVRVIASAKEDPSDLWRSRFAPQDGVAGMVAVTQAPVVISRASRSPQFRTLGTRVIESVLAVPVVDAGELRGVVTVTSPRQHAFTNRSLECLAVVARQFSAALALADRTAWMSHLAGLAHDLATPISSVRGFLELMRGQTDALPPQLRDYLQLSSVATEQLVHLVGDMRDVLSMSRQNLELRLGVVDAAALLRSTVALLQPLADEAEVTLYQQAEAGLPNLTADRHRLERVLANLMQNAIKFTPAGGGVRATLRRTDAAVRFCIDDEGPGIAPADLPRLFDMHYQGTTPNPKAITGHGIGLSVARTLARAHGGDLFAENLAQGGARFSLVLPLMEQHQPNVQGPAPAVRLPPAWREVVERRPAAAL